MKKNRNRTLIKVDEFYLGKWDNFGVSIVDKVDLDVAGSWIGVGHCSTIPHSVSIPGLIK